MKFMASLSVCMLVISATYAQKTVKTTTSARTVTHKEIVQKNNVWGTIKNSRNKPIKGAQAFLYRIDSSIIASGFTDSAGHFETNNVPDGAYYMKIVYPNKRAAIVAGVDVKKGPLELNVKIDAPAEVDTILGYKEIMAKPEPKKDTKTVKK
jgi:flagellar hook assembly protein FlgD